nr:putative uncharacterized protein DDB_G0271606 [Penaeus vannamei]
MKAAADQQQEELSPMRVAADQQQEELSLMKALAAADQQQELFAMKVIADQQQEELSAKLAAADQQQELSTMKAQEELCAMKAAANQQQEELSAMKVAADQQQEELSAKLAAADQLQEDLSAMKAAADQQQEELCAMKAAADQQQEELSAMKKSDLSSEFLVKQGSKLNQPNQLPSQSKALNPIKGEVRSDAGWRRTLRESQPIPNQFTHFKVPKKPENFENDNQLVRALEKERQIRLSIRIARDEGMIIGPKEKASLSFLQETKGTPITTLNLGNWRSYKLRTYMPEPLRCFTCQTFGHHQANCKAKAKYGVQQGI